MENGDFFAQPLQIPANYEPDGGIERQVVFALADLGEGTAEEVAEHWAALDGNLSPDACVAHSRQVLAELFKKGLVNGVGSAPFRRYNLAKETEVHRGTVDDI